MTFDNILEVMNERGITQKQLADAIGVSQQKVSDWKRGTVKSWNKRIPEIASALGVTVEKLIGTEKSPAENELDEAKQELYRIMDQLSDDDLEKLLDYANLIEAGKQRKTGRK